MPTIKQLHKAEHRALTNAIHRCHNPSHVAYPEYGGRGIRVCKRWLDREKGFERFLKDIGPRPSNKHSLERVNNNRGYTPYNCKWATRSEQQSNRRPYRRFKHKPPITFNGETLTIAEWANKLSIKPNTLMKRIHYYNMPLEEALVSGRCPRRDKGKGCGLAWAKITDL